MRLEVVNDGRYLVRIERARICLMMPFDDAVHELRATIESPDRPPALDRLSQQGR